MEGIKPKWFNNNEKLHNEMFYMQKTFKLSLFEAPAELYNLRQNRTCTVEMNLKVYRIIGCLSKKRSLRTLKNSL